MNNLPKIEDRIDIVYDKYSEEFGHSRLRTNASELPRRLPGFYYDSPDLQCDDYEFVELDRPLGKIVKDRRVSDQELHDNWDFSQKYLSAQSIEENLFYSTQYRAYPKGYQFQTQFPKFEDKTDAIKESLLMLTVANKKLESFDREINRLAKEKANKQAVLKSTMSEDDLAVHEEKLRESSLLTASGLASLKVTNEANVDEPLKPWKKQAQQQQQPVEVTATSSKVEEEPQNSGAKKAIPEYYFYNADMKRVYERTKPGIDGTPVLESPYVLDPKRVQEAFVLRHYGAESVMNMRPDSMFEVSSEKEITEEHMENVVYLQSRKYGFMFDRRTKLKQKQRKGKRAFSPIRSPSHAAALAASGHNMEQFQMHLPGSPNGTESSVARANEIGGGGGGIRPLLNTRHVSLLFRDASSAKLNGAASKAVDFSAAIHAAQQAAGEAPLAAEGSQGVDDSIPPILDIDQAIHAAATALAATLASDSIDENLPLSARRHKADNVFEEVVSTRLDTPTLKRSLSISMTPSRRPSRAASRSNLHTGEESSSSPQRRLSASPTVSPVRHRSLSSSPVAASPTGSFSYPLLQPEGATLVQMNGFGSSPNPKKRSFSDKRPAPLLSSPKSSSSPRSSSPSTPVKTPSTPAAGAISPAKPMFSPSRRASFVPSPIKPVQAPPTIQEEVSTIGQGAHDVVVAAENGEEEEPVPGIEYLTMMVQPPGKAQRKPSIAFSFNPLSGKIEDIHFQSLQPKRRPHSADLDKSTKRSLLRRLQQKSNAAYEYMRQQRRAKQLHHGKDLSKIAKITPMETERERTALMDLFDLCGGKQWHRRDNWGSDRPLREWYGVSVNVEGFVFELHLAHNNLTGPFPDTVMFLPSLEVINMDYNQLHGELPEYAFQNLVNLTVLSVRHNQMTGYIKFDLLTHLTSLRELWLSDNQFNGDIQDGITQLAALTHIDLDNNCLHGPIPRHINRLFNLQHLSLGRNRLTGHIAPGIMSLDRLETLSLYSNRLTGKIPLWLKSMPSLQDLLLFDNCFDKD